MKRCFRICLFYFLFCGYAQAQNMVPNPGFEAYLNTSCGIMTQPEFNATMMGWVNPTGASPQVFFTNNADTCYNHQPENLYAGPIGIKGSQIPRSGNVMIGLWLYTIDGLNQRQYVQSELITPMIAGNTYRVEFYVSLADSMEHSIDKIGAYLSAEAIGSSNSEPLSYTPQVVADGFISDVVNWVQITDTIVAQDDYTYITIGNFFDDANTNTEVNPLSSGAPGTYGAFYFLDDVKIEEVNTTGINDLNELTYAIYPTIVRDELTVQLAETCIIEIYNSLGQIIFTKRASGKINVNMSTLPKGVYIVSLRNEKMHLSRKVIK